MAVVRKVVSETSREARRAIGETRRGMAKDAAY